MSAGTGQGQESGARELAPGTRLDDSNGGTSKVGDKALSWDTAGQEGVAPGHGQGVTRVLDTRHGSQGHEGLGYLGDALGTTEASRFGRTAENAGDMAGDRRWFSEDRVFQEPYSSSLPLAIAAPSSFNDYEMHTRTRNHVPHAYASTFYEPHYIQPHVEEESSRLSQEQQNKALNKLRKQLYNPYLRSIIKRLGRKSTTDPKEGEDEKRCAICLEDFDTKQFVTMTPCNHMFHEECIVPWVKSQGKCPVCRFVLVEQTASPPRRNYTTRG